MTQKNKVKELVGRGLNSYHTKALQQMDRIEKKNKEQNHKISILSNELDNDYLTKTEEGSVISLEHSKEGMVYLDELQGNTLVNYCTDGSKEMTLNGDIDVEGTFVTTTEGVDGGKVDVLCEGNTLVNLVQTSGSKLYGTSGSGSGFTQNIVDNFCSYTIKDNTNRYITLRTGSHKLVKPSTKYTMVFEIKENSIPDYHGYVVRMTDDSFYGTYSDLLVKSDDTLNVGIHKICFTTFSDISSSTGLGIGFKAIVANDNNVGTTFTIGNVLLLEGDWTDKEIPPYFKDMKSVGQDDENGHKIEILSAKGKPNLIKNSGFLNDISNYSFHNDSQGEVMNDTSSQSGKILKITTGSNGGVSGPFQSNIVNYIEDKKYTLSGWCKGEPGTTLGIYIERHKSINVTFTNDDWVRFVVTSEQNPTNWNRTITFYSSNISKVFYLKDIKIEESDNDTPYIPHISEKNYNSFNGINKKEILLNEPLRGLPNGVKDRFVKLGGKWYIERNCVGYTPDTSTATFRKHYNVTSIIDFKIDNIKNQNQMAQTFHMECLSTIPYGDPTGTNWQNETHWLKYYPMTKNTISPDNQRDKGSVSIFYNKEWTDQQIIDWCNNNNLKFILPCETPTYEEITDVELMTYLDTTHISNNSTIPCNMKIKNSGYNAIIKPSTLYTVALDTNKNGTIGINLGEAKVTTTNNVATITTPATLADDSLRLYGKGIKGSKVRILEGDKTNWIPSHFEGMKSSFEDKFDATDNTYKMEILSNNKNLLKLDDIVMKGIGAGCTLDACSTDLIQYTSNQAEWTQIFFMMKLKPFTRYTLSVELQSMNVYVFNDRVGNWDANKYIGAMQNTTNTLQKKQFSFTTNKTGCVSIRFTNERMLGVNIAKNIMLSEVVGDYTSKKSNKIQFSSIEPLRGVGDYKDKFVFRNDKLMIQRNCKVTVLDETYNYSIWGNASQAGYFTCHANNYIQGDFNFNPRNTASTEFTISNGTGAMQTISYYKSNPHITVRTTIANSVNEFKNWVKDNNIHLLHPIIEPTYEEIPFELQKIILEGYKNGTLFFDTNIPPTSTVTYAGETPIVKSVKLNKTEVLNNTNDINDNIVPYLMDMDYRVVCLQLQSEEFNNGVSMARLFGGAYEMLKRDIQSKRYSMDEYRHRLDAYLDANKITEEEYNKLGDMLNE